MSAKLRKSGDVLVKYIVIHSSSGVEMNVTPQVFNVEIYEDITSPFISGKVFIKDGQNLTNVFPLVGNELIEMELITPGLLDDQGYKQTFFIYGCSDKLKQERISFYELKIISQEAVGNSVTKISRKFSGNPANSVYNILTQSYGLHCNADRVGAIEPCSNNVEFVSNWWNPIKCIKYLTDRSLNTNSSPTYVFFQNKHGFSFVSLDTLFSQDIVAQCFIKNNSATQAAETINSTAQADIEQDYQTIIEMKVDAGYDYFKRLNSGFYGGEVIGFDIATGQYSHNESIRAFNSDNHLNEYSALPLNHVGSTHGNVTLMPYCSMVHDNFSPLNELRYKIERQSFLSRLNVTKLTIKVDGRTDYSIGQLADVLISKDQQILKDEDPYDRLLSGRYLIAAINHSFSTTNNKHECVIDLIKDSYMVDINHSTLNENSKQ